MHRNASGFLPIIGLMIFSVVLILILLGAAFYIFSRSTKVEEQKVVQKKPVDRSKITSKTDDTNDEGKVASYSGNINNLTIWDIAGTKQPIEVASTDLTGWVEYRSDDLNYSFQYPPHFIKGDYGIIQSTKDFESPDYIGISEEPVEIHKGLLEDLVSQEILPGKIEKNFVPNETVSYHKVEDLNNPDRPVIYHDVFLQNSQSYIFLLRLESHSHEANDVVNQIIKTIKIVNKEVRLSEEEMEIKGTVLQKSGNCMPTICVDLNNCGSSSCKTEHVSRKVHVFSPVVNRDIADNYYNGKGVALRTIQSDSRGNFSLMLKPGSYSIMAEDGGKPFCNLSTNYFSCLVTFTKPGDPLSLIIDKASY